jgi:hypothetical protein
MTNFMPFLQSDWQWPTKVVVTVLKLKRVRMFVCAFTCPLLRSSLAVKRSEAQLHCLASSSLGDGMSQMNLLVLLICLFPDA